MRFGKGIIKIIRTTSLGGFSGRRSVWQLPNGQHVHAIEDNPIPKGVYFLRPDETGRFKHWVFEGLEAGLLSRIAVRGTEDVKQRDQIEVHYGTRLEHTRGCTCPGLMITGNGVGRSNEALELLHKALQRDEKDPPIWLVEIV